MAGLGCFGPSFLMGLDYFTSETSASSSFGVLITLSLIVYSTICHVDYCFPSCPLVSLSSSYFVLYFFSRSIIIPVQMVVLLAGVVGTPLGGLLADYCQTCQENVKDLHGYDEEEENEGDSLEQNELGDVVVVVDYESSTTSSPPASLLPSTDGYGREDIESVDNITKNTHTNDVYTNINRSHPNSHNINNSVSNGVNDSAPGSNGLIDHCSDHPLSDPLLSQQHLFEHHHHHQSKQQHVSFSHTKEPLSSINTTTFTNFRQLKIMMMIVAASTLSATICLCSTYWVTSREVFMLCVTGGCTLVFLCNPAVRILCHVLSCLSTSICCRCCTFLLLQVLLVSLFDMFCLFLFVVCVCRTLHLTMTASLIPPFHSHLSFISITILLHIALK